jgi:hypothetical protein
MGGRFAKNEKGRFRGPINKRLIFLTNLERANGFEPSTLTLATLARGPKPVCDAAPVGETSTRDGGDLYANVKCSALERCA